MKFLFLSFLKFYKKHISPIFEYFFGKGCRFTPTCSEYMYEAVEKKGFLGFAMGVKRILKCHPWGGSSWDPV